MPGQVSTPFSIDAASDLTSKRYYLCKATSSGFDLCDTAGEMVDGVIGYSTSTSAIAVERGPVVTVKAGAAFAKGAKLSTDANGKAVTATTGYHVFARALEAAGADGDEVRVALVMSFAPALSVNSLASASSSGAIAPTDDYVLLSVDGTKAYTLDDGDIGHEITIECIAGTNTPVGTLTFNGAQAAYGTEATTVVFTSAGQMVTLVMTSTGWKRVAFSGATTHASGALNLHAHTNYLSVTNTVAYTLADGIRIGQRKRIECSAVSGTPVGTLTINAAWSTEPTSWVFTAVGQALELEWTATGWKLLLLRQIGTEALAASATANPLCLIHFVNLDGANDYIQEAGLIAGQRSVWMATAGTTGSTISGVFYDEDASADGIDINFNAAGDLAVLSWPGTRWLGESLVSCTVTT